MSLQIDQPSRSFLGHPLGLRTLFFTEMWERFSYYGMRALLVLFMVDAIERGGLGLGDRDATAIYGLYTGAVYLVCLPGGWLADRLLGQQRAIWHGGFIIMMGHFTLALPGLFPGLPSLGCFYSGLILIVVGTGLLKPNISAIVGRLYPEGGARRDAGFSIFYMGINTGATLGPLVCSYLGETVNWHLGFAAAGFGMLLGLIQFRWTRRTLGNAGIQPISSGDLSKDERQRRSAKRSAWIGAALMLAIPGLVVLAGCRPSPVALARWTGVGIVALAAAFFAWILLKGRLHREERRRVVVIAIFFVGAAIFWSGFEQAGSTLNLFAERYTDRSLLGNWFRDGEHPAGYYQSVNPLFIILLAPVFAWIWTSLAARNLEPSAPLKFAVGLLQLGLGFGVMAVAAVLVLQQDGKVLPTWLLFTYLLHTSGELCLSPIGLSWVTKLAPAGHVGQLMGTWFMGSALGNLVGGLIAGHFSEDAVDQMPRRFTVIVITTVLSGLVFAAAARRIQRLIGDVR